MIQHLPADSAAAHAIHGPWGNTEALLWDISTHLRELLSLTYNANRAKGAQPVSLPHLPTPEPTEYQRARKQQEEAGSAEERADLLRVLARKR